MEYPTTPNDRFTVRKLSGLVEIRTRHWTTIHENQCPSLEENRSHNQWFRCYPSFLKRDFEVLANVELAPLSLVAHMPHGPYPHKILWGVKCFVKLEIDDSICRRF